MGRKRRFIAVTCGVACVLLATLMFVSRRWEIGYTTSSFGVGSTGGMMVIVWISGPDSFPNSSAADRGVVVREMPLSERKLWYWRPANESSMWSCGIAAVDRMPFRSTDILVCYFVIWPFLVLGGVASFLFWRSARLVRMPGRCECGYSRAGLAPEAGCPECGVVPHGMSSPPGP